MTNVTDVSLECVVFPLQMDVHVNLSETQTKQSTVTMSWSNWQATQRKCNGRTDDDPVYVANTYFMVITRQPLQNTSSNKNME